VRMSVLSLFFLEPLTKIFLPEERLYWNYVLMAYALGAFLIWIVRRETHSIKETLKYLFPIAVWLRRGTLHDLGFNYLTLALQYSLMGWITATLGSSVAMGISGLSGGIGGDFFPLEIDSEWSKGLVTLIMTIALDLSLYFSHWLLHRVPFLWPFHAVHHSAEGLTPLTAYRQHPVDMLLNAFVSALLIGSTLGLLRIILGPQVQSIGINGQTVVILIFYLLGYHLRHSHIWLDYGSKVSRILISPAQHQIHHSIEARHHDRNFGYMLALWDDLFGTLYVPSKREHLTFGIEKSFLGPPHTFFGLIFNPFKEAAQQFKGPWALLTMTLVSGIALMLPHSPITRQLPETSRPTLELSELTSPEVGGLVHDGFLTIIVPTGGTEQNGPHLTLGKHNVIVRHNAIEIAHRLGHTLVAPVMAYVPEGDIATKEGHMAHPGTLSIRSEIFQALLWDTASSLKAHGFRRIIFLGDSGGNQRDQEKIAKELSSVWQEDGVQVLALSEYYLMNHQLDYLQSLGYDTASIGLHAGMRETSELLFIDPSNVRVPLLADHRSHASEGSDGNPLLANSDLGHALTELKIESAMLALKKNHSETGLAGQAIP